MPMSSWACHPVLRLLQHFQRISDEFGRTLDPSDRPEAASAPHPRRRGVLACGYPNAEIFNKTVDAGTLVASVRSFDDMLTAKVARVSAAAAEAGIQVGMSDVLYAIDLLT